MKNVRLQFTQWEDLTDQDQSLFSAFMGGKRERGRSLFELFFYWYNIPHEIGHVLRRLYAPDQQSVTERIWEEDVAAHQFAVAFWRAKGQTARLLELDGLIREALRNVRDPVPPNEDRAVYLNRHFQELADPADYAHYQFNMVRTALARPLDFPQALKKLISPGANDGITIPLSPDFPLDEDLPYRIVDDMYRTLNAYGLQLPEIQVVCMYSPALQFVVWDS